MNDGQADLSDALPSKIKDWLTSQGYPLEMYTLQKCREAGMSAIPSWYYLDEESGNHRESDVRASTPRAYFGDGNEFHITAVLECKQSRDKPWVVFTDDRKGHYRRNGFLRQFVPAYVMPWWHAVADVITHNHLDYPLKPTRPIGHTLVRVSFTKSSEDAAYSALVAVTKAAIGYMREYSSFVVRFEKEFVRPFYELTIIRPILVLDAPLFMCALTEDGDVLLEQIDRCAVDWVTGSARISPAARSLKLSQRKRCPAY